VNKKNQEEKMENKEKTFGFSAENQKKIFVAILKDEKFLKSHKRQIKPYYFDYQVLKDMSEIVFSFFEKYSRIPKTDEFLEELDTFISKGKKRRKDFPANEYLAMAEEALEMGRDGNLNYAKDIAKDFARHQAMSRAILEAGKKLKRDDFEGIVKSIQEGAGADEDEELQVVCLKDILPEKLEWLWAKRIPNKKLTLIVGDPETGKSFFSAFLASHVSNGKPLPHCPDVPTDKGEILILTAEDGLADTVRPRIDLTGGKPSKIHIIEGTKKGRYFDLSQDIPKLEKTLKLRKNIKLLIIDPISAYVGKKSMNNPGEMRELLKPLSALAEKYEFALICIAHLNKNDSLKAAYRVSGTIGIIAAARAVWLAMKDEEDEKEERRFLCCLKMNIAKKPKRAMVFRIWEKENRDPGFEFLDELAVVDVGVELSGEAGPVREAMKIIKAELKSEPKPARKMFEAGKLNGIGAKAMRRAAKSLGVVVWQEWTNYGNRWLWNLPVEERKKEDNKKEEDEIKESHKKEKEKSKKKVKAKGKKKIKDMSPEGIKKTVEKIRAKHDKKKEAGKANAGGKK